MDELKKTLEGQIRATQVANAELDAKANHLHVQHKNRPTQAAYDAIIQIRETMAFNMGGISALKYVISELNNVSQLVQTPKNK